MPPMRPQTYLNWTDGSPSKVVEPPSNFSLQGWQPAAAPPAQFMNWLFWLTDQWIQYLDPLVSEGTPDQAMRLLNGGIWSFNATTGVLAWSQAFDIAIPSVPDSANQVNAGSVTLTDGQLAYVDLNSPLVLQGDTQNGSPVVQNLTFTNQVTSGMNVVGPGIPNGTTVLSVAPTSVTLSANATATATGVTLVFSAQGPLTAQVANSGSFVPAFNQIIFARRSGPVVYLGVNSSQMLLRDKEFKPLLGSGYFTVYEAPAGQNLTAGQLVYISSGAADSGRTAGSLYPLDASAANQLQRGNFAGMIISDVLSGGTAEVLYNGFYALTSLTPGRTYYADPNTPGGMTSTVPSGAGQKIVPVGLAVTATDFLVSGTPSPGGSFTTPVFDDAIIGYGNGTNTDFLLPSEPLSADALFVYVDGLIIPKNLWSLVTIGPNFYVRFVTAPEIGVQVYEECVLAQQGYIAANQEKGIPATIMSTLVWTIVGSPLNKSATRVFVDGLIVPSSKWTLTEGAQNYISFPTDTPSPSQDVYVAYFEPASTGGGSITGASNEGTGVGVFDSILGSNLVFRSIKAGSGVTVVDDGLGDILISAPGSGGYFAHGSETSPVTVSPGSGITPSADLLQTWYIKGPTSGGAQVVTANPQIGPHTQVGARLAVINVSPSDYVIFKSGNGLFQNGDWPDSIIQYEKIEYEWTGLRWTECNRL